MKMVNMKQEAKSSEGPEISSMKENQPAYPYGLKIHLDHEAIEKLGIKELPEVGSKMKLVATVEVCDVSMNESKLYGENSSIGLQITDMSLGKSAESGLEKPTDGPPSYKGQLLVEGV